LAANAPDAWTILPYHLGSSALHFALGDALVRSVRQPTIWAHSADRLTLILGAAQSASDLDLSAVEAAGITIAHRRSGGTSVLATPDVLGVDIAVPAGHHLALKDVVEAYRWVGETWCAAVRSLGADARVVGVAEARAGHPDSPADAIMRLACFGTLSPYEVVVGRRKLVGLAQVRMRNGVLWQSGVHIHFPAEIFAGLLGGDQSAIAAPLRERAIDLVEAAGLEPTLDDVQSAFVRAVESRLDTKVVPRGWSPEELDAAPISNDAITIVG
jgi:lipoate---protein ligase